MKNLPNIEKSFFRPGEYLGWNSKGQRYKIRRENGWWITYAPYSACSQPGTYPSAKTLGELSIRLSNIR